METINIFLLVLQVIIAFSLVGLILVQHGKGADAGATFGSAASTTIFGSQGSGNFLTKTTAALAFLFLANSLLLGYFATQKAKQPTTVMDSATLIVEDIVETKADQSDMKEVDGIEIINTETSGVTEETEILEMSDDSSPTETTSDIPKLP